ncbi:MAG: VacB/RNase II family 3'-5' exoribonuclease [Ruminococcaceae bacterium]|nr:VacB/RNase II family 3'-5' exoribonuclease [Oscillospiraceae bacterium]
MKKIKTIKKSTKPKLRSKTNSHTRTHSGSRGHNKSRIRLQTKKVVKSDNPLLTSFDLEAFIKENGTFPENVINEASEIYQIIPEEIIQRELNTGKRKDLRYLNIVTIDSEDTKDVDDGVSIEITKEGNYLLGVHIADVAEYVTEDSAIDAEARRRGTSVYLTDRVLPMLPSELSNGICSLNIGENRFALSVFMEINHKGKVLHRKVCQSIIQVKYKRTYKEIYHLFTDATKEEQQSDPFFGQLELMKQLAEILHVKRYKMGCLDFDFPETKITVADNGQPISIGEYITDFSHNIIEEFMIACNETVSEFFTRMNVPFMYREHKNPEKEKLETLAEELRGIGFTLDIKKDDIPEYKIQKLLEKAKDSPKKLLVNTLVLRSMPKAEYVTESEGHFAIATDYYSHFTSPIRRYPDLFIHRIIKKVLCGGMSEKEKKRISAYNDAVAKHCSETERQAQAIELLDTNIKIAEYMRQFLGESYSATVTSITSFGIFARLDNSAEGLLFYNAMPEYMIYDPKRLVAIGERSKQKISVGDKIEVTVARVDTHLGKIEFS